MAHPTGERGSSSARAFRWIRPESARTLAAFRICVVGLVLLSPEWREAGRYLASRPPHAWAPEGLGVVVAHLPFTMPLVRAAQAALVVSATSALLGIAPRIALAILTVVALYLFAPAQLQGSVLHDMHLFWFMALLAASPCGDAFVLPLRHGADPNAPRLPSWDRARAYAVPLAVARLLLGLVYFFPGVWKLATSGLAWMSGENVRNHMYWKWYEESWLPPFRFDEVPGLCAAGGVFVVGFELSFVVLAQWRRTRELAAIVGLAFHSLAQLLLRIPFVSLWACYVVLLDFDGERAPDDARPRGSSARVRSVEPATLLVSALLVGGVAVQGARGAVQAWPLACYPTFAELAPSEIPRLRVEALLEDGQALELPARPRSPSEWATSWRLACVYGGEADPDSLRRFAVQLLLMHPEVPRGRVQALRFSRAYYAVAPERWSDGPVRAIVLATLSP